MGKLTQVNQFNGGMIKDLHPLNTPNTVLTDCLNGTLLTYNGNEFTLQNDMGNYAFTNGSLSKNYVPVGLKEHNGILYIISYNPIDNKVEIGTFPSQQTIWNSVNNKGNSELSFIDVIDNTYVKFSDIQTSIIQLSNNKDVNLFLNPGDKYLLKCKNDNGDYIDLINEKNEKLNWQHLNLYALTDENKLYKINTYIQFSTTDIETNEDYTPIDWEIPGWLAASFELNVPDEFSAYFDITGITIDSENGELKMHNSGILKLKTIWDTKIYKDNINYLANNLVFIFHNEVDDYQASSSLLYKETMTELDYNDLQTILYCTYKMNSQYNYVTPALYIEDKNSYIVYNQFTTSLQDSEQILDENEITLGDDTFKYIVDSDSVTFTFNFKAYPGVKLGYNLYRYSDPRYSNGETSYTEVILENIKQTSLGNEEFCYTIDDINYNGINIFDIAFSKNPSKNAFDKEDIYLIKFRTFIDSVNGVTILNSKINDRVLYISEVTNYYSAQDIYEFTVTEWANNASLGLSINVNDLEKNLEFDNSIYRIETQPLRLDGVKETKEALSFEETAYKEGTSELDYNKLLAYYGDGFGSSYLTEPLVGTVLYNSINRYILQSNNPSAPIFTLNAPLNQYININGEPQKGRLWANTELSSISSQSSIVDTLNQAHLLNIKGNKIDDEYYDLNSEVSLDIKDQYILSVASSSVEYSISSSDIFPYELDKTEHLKINENIGTKENPILKLSSFIRFVTVHSDDFIAEVSVLKYPIYGTFVDNVLYAGDSGFNGYTVEDNIKSIKLGTASKDIKDFYRVTDFSKLHTIYPIQGAEGIAANYGFVDKDGMTWGTSWLNSDSMRSIYNTLNGIQPIIYESRTDKVKRVSIETMTTDHGQFAYGLFINSTTYNRPFGMLYSKEATTDAEMTSEAICYWFSIMNYMRICNGVRDSKLYITNLSMDYDKFKSYTTKLFNISCRYKWNYLGTVTDSNTISNTINTLYNELNSSSNNIVRAKIPVTKTMYFKEDQSNQNLSLLIEEINTRHKEIYDKYINQERLSRFSAYLTSDYSEGINLAKLTKIIKTMNYSPDKEKLMIEAEDSLISGRISLGFGSNKLVHVSQVFSELAKY